MNRFIRICMVVGIALLLSACGEKDAMLTNIRKEVDNETYNFSNARYIEVLSECSTDEKVAEEFIQLIYLAYLEKYNQKSRPLSLFETLKYQIPYSLLSGLVLLIIIIVWYIIGLPIGFGATPVI